MKPDPDYIKDMLRAESKMIRVMARKPIGQFYSMGEFVLKHGKAFKSIKQKLPVGVRRGRMGRCFQNAANLAVNDSRFTYCEGYAAGVIPLMHAWCIDKDGNVIDPTWADDLGHSYFGVPFKTKYLIHSLLETETYGLIDRYEHNWPALRADPKDFLHTCK